MSACEYFAVMIMTFIIAIIQVWTFNRLLTPKYKVLNYLIIIAAAGLMRLLGLYFGIGLIVEMLVQFILMAVYLSLYTDCFWDKVKAYLTIKLIECVTIAVTLVIHTAVFNRIDFLDINTNNLLLSIIFTSFTLSAHIATMSYKRFFIKVPEKVVKIIALPAIVLICAVYAAGIHSKLLEKSFANCELLYVLLFFATTVISITAIFLVAFFTKRQKQEAQLESYEHQLSLQIEYYKELDAYINRVRFLRHDVRNYLQTMETLLINKEYDKAKAFINSIYQQYGNDTNTVFCENRLADALLKDKYDKAVSDGIDCSFDVRIAEDSGFDSIMLCSAIGSILDKAIESQEFVAEKIIDFNCVLNENGCLSVQLKTTLSHLDNPKSQRFAAPKREKDKDDIRNQMLKHFVDIYGGSLEQRYEPNFTVTVLALQLSKAGTEIEYETIGVSEESA